LLAIHRGESQLSPFMTEIETYVHEVMKLLLGGLRAMAAIGTQTFDRMSAATAPGQSEITVQPRPPRSREIMGTFGRSGFRPHQEVVCIAACDGEDALPVMPTGAGKSLCYQFPGLARGGTTLVVSPLIALMADQVAKLPKRQATAKQRI